MQEPAAGELWVVRHGETAWSSTGQHTSVSDVPLTPAGERSAAALRAALGTTDFDLVLTSPRARARRTAELAGYADAQVEEDLAEWAYGDYEGLTTPEIRAGVPGWTVWSHPCPGGESAREVTERLDRVVARARASRARVLVFGHGHASRALACRWLGLPVDLGRHFRLDPARVSVLSYERETPVMARWNAAV